MKRAQRLQSVLAKAIGVGERRIFFVDTAIDAAPKVFNKSAVYSAIYLANLALKIYFDSGHLSLLLIYSQRNRTRHAGRDRQVAKQAAAVLVSGPPPSPAKHAWQFRQFHKKADGWLSGQE